MGYLIDLPQDRSFLGLAIPEVYHSIDSVELKNSKVEITVGVYMTRESKYTKKAVESKVLAPEYLPAVYSDEGELIPQTEPDIASYSTVQFVPIRAMSNAKLGQYFITVSASALYPDGMPYDLDSQRASLYPTVKRLLGHDGGVDVFEVTESEEIENIAE